MRSSSRTYCGSVDYSADTTGGPVSNWRRTKPVRSISCVSTPTHGPRSISSSTRDFSTASCTPTPWRQSAQVGATVQSWWTPTLRLDAASPTAAIVERLNAWQPETLVAYASTADLLAKEQIAGRLHINPRDHSESRSWCARHRVFLHISDPLSRQRSDQRRRMLLLCEALTIIL